MTNSGRILLAEDDPVITMIIEHNLTAEGHQVVCCSDGNDAWRLLAEDSAFDLILLDRMMPGMDGMALLRAIKDDPRFEYIPVILETALADNASIREGLDAGAHYYLTKPFQPDVLVGVVSSALEQIFEFRKLQQSVEAAERPFELLQEGVFQFRSLDEARLLANFLARACPDPGLAIHGLQELLINAVEHGDLGLSYADKGELLQTCTWEEEVARRLALPEYRDRHVEIRFAREEDRIRFVIRDQGDGFDWRDYLDFSPERAFDLHGRGIAMARKLSFDCLEYQGNGNTVEATISLPASDPRGTVPPQALP